MIWDFKTHKENTALLDDQGNGMTYGELLEEGEALAEKIPRRSLVFSFCKNAIGSVLGYTAFLNHDIVPVLLKPDLEEKLQKNLLKTYRPDGKRKSKKRIFGIKGNLCLEGLGAVCRGCSGGGCRIVSGISAFADDVRLYRKSEAGAPEL